MTEENQDRTKVRIYTDQFMIIGDIAMFADSRLTDFMVSAHDFIALTDVTVNTLDGKTLFKTAFLNVQKEKINITLPESMVVQD
ncbi:hypothetical protein DSCW_20870 [Desulfosarcina widdelii]|uniref:Uncharacterized protein n=1 Tax=Desulfosarcina widdelii TaxID=947919 RepID=A0A5K7Z1Y7_9BACT|nr:hypothetical protein [Desulfosarcina widdelii]BBO74670.1 hypothetical protein DSCW_20870 [Desulfosarcina widdelii]